MRELKTVCLLIIISLACKAQPYDAKAFKEKAITLRIFLEKQHYSPLRWSDTTSVLLYNRWLDILDNDKIYFTQADINTLEAYKTTLDDEMNSGDWTFFEKSILLYKKAVHKVDSLQKQILAKPADFSKPDVLRYPFANYASNNTEQQQRLIKLIKWRLLHSIAVELDSNYNATTSTLKMPADFVKKESKAREKLKRQHEINIKELGIADKSFEEKMAEKYLQAITWCYDPHTQYMNLTEKKGFETDLSGFEYSTGIELEQNDDGNYEVGGLEPGGNAWRSGELHKGDVVLSIKKKNGDDKELSEMDEDEVDNLLSGNSDEEIELTIKAASGATKKIALTKEKVTNDEGIVKSYTINGPQKIGYIKLPDFYSREIDELDDEDVNSNGCANDISKEIIKLTKDTISGLILDLRYNGGGSMWEAMQLAGIFIDYGPVGSVKEKNGEVHFLKDPNRGTAYDGPLLVLVNGFSASASELTSAMLQDYKRALIVGSTTYGKGTSQRILPLDTTFIDETNKNYTNYKDFVKVTNGKFYRINGTTTQWKGVVPDIMLPDIFEGLEIRESQNASALLPDNSKKGIYKPLIGIPIERLKEKSNSRIASDSLFAKVKTAAAFIKYNRDEKDVQLQWQPYTTSYLKNEAIFKQLEEVEEGNQKTFPVSNNNFDKEKIRFATASGKQLNERYIDIIAKDAYINEAYNIMIDWINN